MGYPTHRIQPTHKPIDNLYTDRLRQFIDKGGQYHSLNLPQLYDLDRKGITGLQSYRVPDGPEGETLRPLFKEIDWDNVEWEDIGVGYQFGPSWKTFWVKFTIELDEDWLGKQVEIEWNSSSEALIYNDKGSPLQAFTDGQRNYFRFPKEYVVGGPQTFYIEVACNGMFGNGSDGHPDPNRQFRLNTADLVLPNIPARKLYVDFLILSDGAREFSGGTWQKYKSLAVCNDIMDAFNPKDPKTVEKGRELAKELLGPDIDSEDVFDSYNSPDKRVDVIGIGNCHIDTAWEWPFAETKRKIVRSWTTQLKICDEYPEFVFVASQMQQFKWLKQSHPEILDKIKEKFTTNQFFPIGGSWVENDTNLPNGESLIRQFLVGQRWQYNEFGFYSNIYWLPDTFGYSSQIPQICQISGISRFLTQKLSWNNINSFPLSTFNWVGLDGSQLLVHMPPDNTYTAGANFGDVVRSQSQHKNLGSTQLGMLLYGHGDGGGGPTEEMVEKIRRCRGLANTSGLMQTVHLGPTVDDFYDKILDSTNDGNDLPSWLGEMYLEYHRGTYTTQALIKKLERYGEVKIHDLEYLAGLVSLFYDEYKYPKDEILAIWEDLLLCQFHDVFPGSCIGMVYYDEAYPMLTKDLKRLDELIDEALEVLKSDDDDKLSMFNPSPWPRHDIVVDTAQFPEVASFVNGNLSLASITDEGTVFNAEIQCPASVSELDDSYVLSNGLLKATISKCGIITSLFDVVNHREVIDKRATKQTKSGSDIGGNQFILVDDEPLNFPAWDTEIYSLDKFEFLTTGKVIEVRNHKVESAVVVRHEISDESWIETTISIQGLSGRAHHAQNYVKFSSKVEWHETYKFLKVQFPTTVYTATQANYETQFGITQRPTHFNTSWDTAKFEVCHHKFMDLSDYNYGVSVINESKYGGSIHGNLIRLSLLRSAKAPDDKADMGTHEFEYALYPHAGTLGPDTVKLAWDFNYRVNRVIADSGQRLHELVNLVKLEQPPTGTLVLSHVKRGENDADVNTLEAFSTKSQQRSLVLRVYESLGGWSSGKLRLDPKLGVSKVVRTNALEEEQQEEVVVMGSDGTVPIRLKGFEIATFKVYLK